MATPPVVADTLRINLQWADGSDNAALTRLYWGYSGSAPDAAGAAAIAEDIYNAAHSEFLGVMWHGNSLTGVEVFDLASDTGVGGTYADTHGGTLTGGPLPAGTAVLINHHIARHYRGGKPRSYVPFGDDGMLQNPQTITAAFVASVQAAWSAFIASVKSVSEGGTVLSPGQQNVSFYKGYEYEQYGKPVKYRRVPLYRDTVTPDPITGFTVSNIPASQRRRQRAR